jgi:hypothetical protein
VLLPVTFWNDHDHEVGYPVVVSLNLTVRLSVPVVTFALKLAVGAAGVTLMNVTDELSVPPAFVAFNKIDQLPTPKVYVTLFVVENWTLVLLPGVMFWNDHDHEVGVPVEVSLNFTATGAVPEVTFAVKLEVGAGIWLTLINTV